MTSEQVCCGVEGDEEMLLSDANASKHISPDVVLGLVDLAVSALGGDPEHNVDAAGWRYLRFGTAHSLINVVEWHPDVYMLVMWSPILRVPDDARLRAWLFEHLLRLNHNQTGVARFSLKNDLVILSFVRPIQGLNFRRVLDTLRLVMHAADSLDEPLQNAFEITMPRVDLPTSVWTRIWDVLRLCDTRAQALVCSLIEQWHAAGGHVLLAKHGVGCGGIALSEKVLLELCSHPQTDPELVLDTEAWSQWGMRTEEIEDFLSRVPCKGQRNEQVGKISFPMDAEFTLSSVTEWVTVLQELDEQLEEAVARKRFAALPDLNEAWGLDIEVSNATRRGVHAIFNESTPRLRELYGVFIRGWYEAGERLYTSKLDRLYLRLYTSEHKFALVTLYGPQHQDGARLELRYPLTYYLESYEEARQRYEQTIEQVVGFDVHHAGARVPMTEDFQNDDAVFLLEAMCRLAKDVKSKDASS